MPELYFSTLEKLIVRQNKDFEIRLDTKWTSFLIFWNNLKQLEIIFLADFPGMEPACDIWFQNFHFAWH